MASAAIPAAAALAPLIAQTGAAAVAVAAFGAAIVPQVMALGEASQAQKKYEDAVAEGGKASEAAIQAELAYQRQLAKMPPATREASAALSTLTDQFSDWSDALAANTMPVFTKSLAVAGGLLPKLTPMVKGASVELSRFMTLIGGGMSMPGFDRVMGKFSDFATVSLRRANDGLVHLTRTLGASQVGGSLAQFMDYARSQGPLVGETLRSIASAVLNILTAASDVGVGVLQLANAFAKVVAALPPSYITTLFQAAVAIRAIKLAISGVQLAAGAFVLVRTQIMAAGTAAIGASGAIGTLRVAFMAMSRSARIAVASTGIGLLVLGLIKLSSIGKQAPPDVDRLTTSLGKLAQTGKVSGEAAKAFGTDLGGLAESLRTLSRPGNLDKTQQFLTQLVGMDSTPVKEAKQDLDAVDQALTGLVKGGKSEVAAAAFDKLAAGMKKNGMSAGELRDKLDGYQSALADQAFEQQLAAASMGLFGTQAQQVQAKLDAQKQSADGLRQSISALNDTNRTALGGMIGFEAAIDAATKTIKGNEHALSMSGNQLNLNSEKARTAAGALNDLAAKTDEAAAQARQSGASWETVNGIYARGRQKLIESADAMGLNSTEARKLADQILKTPDKTARLKGNLEDLEAKLATAKSKLGKVPDSRKAQVKANIGDLQEKIAQAKRELAEMDGRTATASVMVQYRSNSNPSSFAQSIGGYASGGRPKPGELAWVGEEGPELMRFGGGGTEIYDHRSSMAMVADASAAGRDAGLGLRRGMGVSAGEVGASGRQLASALLGGITDELEIASPSKKTARQGHNAGKGLVKGMRRSLAEIKAEARRMAALALAAGKSLISGLTGSKSQIASTAKSLTSKIQDAWRDRKTTVDDRLISRVSSANTKLQKLATQRDKIAAKIAEAKKYAASVTATARQDSSLEGLGIEDGKVTAGSIKAGLQKKLAKLNQFSRYINTLAKRGLSKTLLRQILDMGPEQGYAYANALAGASASTIKSINSTQSALTKGTDALGKKGADLLYDSGKNAAKGYLKGLDSQQAAIEKQMVKIAQGMQKAIRKALGIKSPSRVMAQLGRYSTEGLAVGLTERMPVLDRALGAVTDRVASAQPVIGRPAVVGGGGAQPVQIQIDVHGAMDPVAVGRELRRVLLQLKRTQGVNVNLGVA
ncbi:hypothetical protein OG369_09780 [Streptomyces sp. NBC_01221]|uniref:hypothetical protein n=1 Tax=Streptomyces sp. NBC_01221 TaxID=2903782 RepID=UPI00224EC717|nr:hypothetical protein [Streptomyces sp. NBC_01221]MCX4786460.1 hypothetical protein [Streptomyces sp. NBC_01221]